MKTFNMLMAAVAIVPLLTVSAIAEDAHHPVPPQTAQATPPSATPPVPGQPGATGPGMGMMGQGMGMMGPGGHGMMGGMMPMMMGQGAGAGGMGGPGMSGGMGGPGMSGGMGGMGMMIDRVEGRIAFLKAELKITEAQSKAWNEFADTLRANAKKLGEVRTAMLQQHRPGQSLGLGQHLDHQERMLTARLDGVRTMKTAFANLSAVLSDEQKKAAQELFGLHMGIAETP